MRKVILIFVTLIALVGAFSAYFLMQSNYAVSVQGDKSADDNPSTGDNGGGIIKPGAGAWSKQFDRLGNLYYQFKCDFYDPQPDGTVKVTLPVIQFFLSGGRLLQIEGQDGTIRFAQGADKGMLNNTPSDPPRNGTLRHVKVKLFNSTDQSQGQDPEMTMTMTNAQFDDDTYRLFTEEFIDNTGKVVHADEVPVTVDARDYSFIGSGLVLYWNDVDKQLKSLEIAHGKDMTISAASGFTAEPATATNSGPASPSGSTAGPPGVTPVPSNDAAAPSAQPQPSRQRYTATFFNNVRIVQGDDVVTGDRLDVDFSPKAENSPADNTPPVPATEPSPSSNTPATTAPSPTSPTPPARQMIHVTWTGPMRMVPTDIANSPPLADGKAIVHLIGSPMKMHDVGADRKQWVDLQCNDLQYRTEDSSAQLLRNVLLTQSKADGTASTASGQSLYFSRLTHVARFDGPGQTRFADPNDPKSVLTSAWQKSCTLHLYDLEGNQSQIENADLEGNVVVDDAPRFHMTARDNLLLQFDRLDSTVAGQSSNPPLRQISANGDADCLVHDADQQVRRVRGQHLELFRDPGPDGKLYAKTILCNGSVLAEQDAQSLAAEAVQIDLLPAQANANPKPGADPTDDVALDRLIATKNVIVKGKDGSSASADSLEVDMIGDHPHVTLLGSDQQPAIVRNKTSTLTGGKIQMAPHDQTARIDGPGTFDGLQESKSPGEKPRPMKLAWSRGAWLNGNANRVVVDGDVAANSDDPDGTHQSAACGRIVATLVDVAPSSRPAAKPLKKESFADGDDFLKDKQIQSISLQTVSADATPTTQPTAEVKSYLLDADGFLLHQYDLITHTRIDYTVPTRRLTVPGPGDIVAIEQSPPTTQPAANNSSAIGGQGNTVIDWQKQFVYDDSANSAVIEGDVRIVHQGVGPKSESLRLDHADIVTAEFDSSARTQPSGAAGQPPAPRLKRLTSTGDMKIRTADKTIFCGELDFDPVEGILTCLPGNLAKVTVVDDNNLAGGSCSEAVFNLKTNELKEMTNVTGQGR